MQHQENSRNSFCYSIHRDRSFLKYRYAKGYRAVEQDDWRAFAAAILCDVWSPCVWKDGARASDNFEYSDLCGLDFDGTLPLLEAIDRMKDRRLIIGLTQNHMRPKHGLVADRFRVVIPWERRITSLDEYLFNMERLHKKYDSDPQALDAGRFFWPCTKIAYGTPDGEPMEVEPVPEGWLPRAERIVMVAEKFAARAKTGTLSRFARSALMHGVERFTRNKSMYAVAIELAHLGYSSDEIFRKLRTSPISSGEPKIENREISATVRSAFSAFRRDMQRVGGEEGGEKNSNGRAVLTDRGSDQQG